MNAGIVTDEMTVTLGLEAARVEINAQAMWEDAIIAATLRERLTEINRLCSCAGIFIGFPKMTI